MKLLFSWGQGHNYLHKSYGGTSAARRHLLRFWDLLDTSIQPTGWFCSLKNRFILVGRFSKLAFYFQAAKWGVSRI
ncbi:hypothetical protein [Kingella negevensis]|uniref:hypothetical protein n=1 Tax=Kingella negevensis TaxID=1522312 RepID=UPI00254C71FD|nr:hypothetical protein [Kingella negevensis]MDK4679690.1 hypothetical protein [Kingella negevensis]MDK4682591.1 hypothetical protein [Kingella negevensis]MDK4690788.1 hypothetical protein [Kingella negevensis]MDK4699793.1 hypothetical protein [Kingella negevensis]